jgi:hypothetical protein
MSFGLKAGFLNGKSTRTGRCSGRFCLALSAVVAGVMLTPALFAAATVAALTVGANVDTSRLNDDFHYCAVTINRSNPKNIVTASSVTQTTAS